MLGEPRWRVGEFEFQFFHVFPVGLGRFKDSQIGNCCKKIAEVGLGPYFFKPSLDNSLKNLMELDNVGHMVAL
jgi:endonuclease III